MAYLVAISIGPVQSFIEAGRRSQDLWCGSWLLSEVSRAVALSLHQSQKDKQADKDHKSCLIFPSLDNPDKALQPQSTSGKPEANIANVVRAEVSAKDEGELKKIIQDAKAAALERLNKLFTDVLDGLSEFSINHERWKTQQEDLLEFFAVWVAFTPAEYKQASARLGLLMQARKQTRNFEPIADDEDGWFKSSLDGANNTVLHQEKTSQRFDPVQDKQLIRALGLTNDEDLDALGVVKRRAGNPEQFTPFNRIVTHHWLKKLQEKNSAQFKALLAAYQTLEGDVTPVSGNEGIYKDFPFDGEYLFTSRLEQADIKNDKDALLGLLTDKDFVKQYSSPIPYGVLLKADGDSMGELLTHAQDPEQSRDISKALHQFANNVRDIVRGSGGHAIYTGGDDVLAFLPLDTAIDCAKTLSEAFKQSMSVLAKLLGVDCPTLSVGLAIGHFVQPMRQLRQRAISAEKHAKGNDENSPRNAFAIHLGIRSGHEITWRCRWDDKETIKALEQLIEAFAKGELPSRVMQDVRAMAPRLAWANNELGIQQSELERMLDRAMQKGGDAAISSDAKDLLRQLGERFPLSELANLLIIARWLSATTDSDIQGSE